MRKMIVLSCPVAMVAGLVVSSHAATLTWRSNGDVATLGDNAIWSNSINWSPDQTPDVGDDLVFSPPVAGGTRTTTNDLTAGIQFGSVSITGNQFVLNGNAIEVAGAVAFTAGATNIGTINLPIGLTAGTTFNVSANTSNGRLEVGGVISGDHPMNKVGDGRLRFVGSAKTYTGNTNVQAGLLDIATNDMLPFGAGRGDVHVAAGAQFVINNVNVQINALNDLDGGAGSVSKTGSNTRTLTLGNGDASGSFSGAITFTGGSSSITKTGLGTQTLSGALSTAGSVTVNGGRLNLNGTLTTSAANSGVIVNALGTLGGTGAIAGVVTGAGTVSPGASIGTLGVGSANLTGTLAIEVDGSAIDLLAVTGELNIASTNLSFDLLSAPTSPALVFATYGSLAGANFLSVNNLPSGYDIDYAYDTGTSTNNIALVVIPEPATLALLAAAGLMALRRR
jgi:autotransporter-associated beta strand protein